MIFLEKYVKIIIVFLNYIFTQLLFIISILKIKKEGIYFMFVITGKNDFPIKIWLNSIQDVENSCLEQAYHLAELPFLHQWVCLMPDTHTGKGMPIGGVIATKDVIIPNAVGVDIGCGMRFVSTNVKLEEIEQVETGNGSIISAMVGDILRNIPVGFSHYKEPQDSYTLFNAENELDKYEYDTELLGQIDAGYFQIGTLGGGNHFIGATCS